MSLFEGRLYSQILFREIIHMILTSISGFALLTPFFNHNITTKARTEISQGPALTSQCLLKNLGCIPIVPFV